MLPLLFMNKIKNNITSMNLVTSKGGINTENMTYNSKNFIEVSEINSKSIIIDKSSTVRKDSLNTNGSTVKGYNIEVLDAENKK